MKIKFISTLLFLLVASTTTLFAQAPGFNFASLMPIDGGILLLLSAATTYCIKAIKGK